MKQSDWLQAFRAARCFRLMEKHHAKSNKYEAKLSGIIWQWELNMKDPSSKRAFHKYVHWTDKTAERYDATYRLPR